MTTSTIAWQPCQVAILGRIVKNIPSLLRSGDPFEIRPFFDQGCAPTKRYFVIDTIITIFYYDIMTLMDILIHKIVRLLVAMNSSHLSDGFRCIRMLS
jgi:hypothetical protein